MTAFHELATVFPLLEGGEYTALIDDIRTHGLLEPITDNAAIVSAGSMSRWTPCCWLKLRVASLIRKRNWVFKTNWWKINVQKLSLQPLRALR
jgi:hypothetical protein